MAPSRLPLVSVVIPTKNRADLVGEAIESVLAVDRQGFEIEVLVVDDGSTDGTASVVAQHPVRYLETSGLGASAARNAGIIAARGDFIAFLDDDDIWLPTNIAPQLREFVANPSYGAVHAQVILTGPDRKPWGAPEPNGPLQGGWIFHDLLSYWPQLASVVVRRSVFRELGLFDVTLHSEEEWDMILRIARHYPVGRVEEPVALFRQRCDNDELLAFRRMPDTIRVFYRYTRTEPRLRRLLLQRSLWRQRGWFAFQFAMFARAHIQNGDRHRAWRCLRYAVIASPLHSLVRMPDFWLSVVQLTARRGFAGRPSSSLSG